MQKFIVLLAASFCLSADAYAYLDGGTGSMLLQLLLGGAVGLSAVAKLYWYRIKSFFSKSRPQD